SSNPVGNARPPVDTDAGMWAGCRSAPVPTLRSPVQAVRRCPYPATCHRAPGAAAAGPPPARGARAAAPRRSHRLIPAGRELAVDRLSRLAPLAGVQLLVLGPGVSREHGERRVVPGLLQGRVALVSGPHRRWTGSLRRAHRMAGTGAGLTLIDRQPALGGLAQSSCPLLALLDLGFDAAPTRLQFGSTTLIAGGLCSFALPVDPPELDVGLGVLLGLRRVGDRTRRGTIGGRTGLGRRSSPTRTTA